MNKNNCLHSAFVKNGKRMDKQRYKCKSCHKSWQESYSYIACKPSINDKVARLTKESCGIRSIARLLYISTNTVLKRIKDIAKAISLPIIVKGKACEVDELRTYIGKKQNMYWLVVGICKESGVVLSYTVGKRNNATLNTVIKTLLNAEATKIYTDKLVQYKFLIPPQLHCIKQFGTNKIERKNLSIRTHLKRLSRRTICYSKSIAMLTASLKIYFWY
jgi:insertion element IS1 protein InsB